MSQPISPAWARQYLDSRRALADWAVFPARTLVEYSLFGKATAVSIGGASIETVVYV
jgi:hypothetical protein